MNLTSLLLEIQDAHRWFVGQAARQVNTALTLRNWVIGMYLFEYEQKGHDRAKYGDGLYDEIPTRLKNAGLKGFGRRNLYLFKDFYLAYPQIVQTVSAQFHLVGNQWVSDDKGLPVKFVVEPDLPPTDPEKLLARLTFSHFIELLKCATPLQRLFYETECMAGNWSVRELRRAMDTALFERTGLSRDKMAVLEKHRGGSGLEPADILRNPYILEFLGLEERAEFSESDLEQAIIDHLQKFLLEAGRGFCFEARQKRLSFGNKHLRVDLVFYHRVLKCHVLFDLKIGEFDHADAGQMNLYLNYFSEHEMTEGDNPPVGIVLCAEKDDALVHYATGGLSQQVFVSQYLVGLPSEEELKRQSRFPAKI